MDFFTKVKERVDKAVREEPKHEVDIDDDTCSISSFSSVQGESRNRMNLQAMGRDDLVALVRKQQRSLKQIHSKWKVLKEENEALGKAPGEEQTSGTSQLRSELVRTEAELGRVRAVREADLRLLKQQEEQLKEYESTISKYKDIIREMQVQQDELMGKAQGTEMDAMLDVLMQSRTEVDKLHEEEVLALRGQVAQLQHQLAEANGKLASSLVAGTMESSRQLQQYEARLQQLERLLAEKEADLQRHQALLRSGEPASESHQRLQSELEQLQRALAPVPTSCSSSASSSSDQNEENGAEVRTNITDAVAVLRQQLTTLEENAAQEKRIRELEAAALTTKPPGSGAVEVGQLKARLAETKEKAKAAIQTLRDRVDVLEGELKLSREQVNALEARGEELTQREAETREKAKAALQKLKDQRDAAVARTRELEAQVAAAATPPLAAPASPVVSDVARRPSSDPATPVSGHAHLQAELQRVTAQRDQGLEELQRANGILGELEGLLTTLQASLQDREAQLAAVLQERDAVR
eukprot:EG_transcript_9448